jgi:hypothetical protein
MLTGPSQKKRFSKGKECITLYRVEAEGMMIEQNIRKISEING